jgi:hypothetical protein
MPLPYKMPFVVTFLDSISKETFTETVCADSTLDARTICHGMYDADIVTVREGTVHPYCVIETDVQHNIESIIYSSVNAVQAERQCDQLNAAFPSKLRYMYRTETLDI